MSGDEYLKPAEEIDMEAAELAIRKASAMGTVLLILASIAAYQALPLFFVFPEELPERLAFAAIASSFVWVSVLIAVGMVSTIRRIHPEDNAGSAAGPPSERLAIPKAFLQNTLEQAGLASMAFFGFAALFSGPWLALIVVAVLFFAVGRILFYRRYHGGTRGRALGMVLTITPTIYGYFAIIGVTFFRLFFG